jgi:serine/threonine protein phosphatase PrpC
MLTEGGQRELVKLSQCLTPEDHSFYPQGLKSFAGCTATVVLITRSEIYCCNAGDSRTVMSKNRVAVDLSTDHKPNLDKERLRIYNADAFVEENRVNG